MYQILETLDGDGIRTAAISHPIPTLYTIPPPPPKFQARDLYCAILRELAAGWGRGEKRGLCYPFRPPDAGTNVPAMSETGSGPDARWFET